MSIKYSTTSLVFISLLALSACVVEEKRPLEEKETKKEETTQNTQPQQTTEFLLNKFATEKKFVGNNLSINSEGKESLEETPARIHFSGIEAEVLYRVLQLKEQGCSPCSSSPSWAKVGYQLVCTKQAIAALPLEMDAQSYGPVLPKSFEYSCYFDLNYKRSEVLQVAQTNPTNPDEKDQSLSFAEAAVLNSNYESSSGLLLLTKSSDSTKGVVTIRNYDAQMLYAISELPETELKENNQVVGMAKSSLDMSCIKEQNSNEYYCKIPLDYSNGSLGKSTETRFSAKKSEDSANSNSLPVQQQQMEGQSSEASTPVDEVPADDFR